MFSKVKDEAGNELKRAFYESELVKWLGYKEPTYVDAKTFESSAK